MTLFAATCAGLIATMPTVATHAAQAGGATVAFEPPQSTVVLDGHLTIDVVATGLDGGPGLNGYTVSLAYDVSVLRLDSLVDAAFAGQGRCAPAEIDNGSGIATLTCEGASGAAAGVMTAHESLVRASFGAIAAGTATLRIQSVALQGRSGTAIPAAADSVATVSVTAATLIPPGATIASSAPTSAPDATGTGGGGGGAWPLALAVVVVFAVVVLVALWRLRWRSR
jgi:hypothetical protein